MAPPPRTFYTGNPPQMTTESEVSSMTSLEIQMACDTLDQKMVAVLGNIDENFSKCNSILVNEIIPAVTKFEDKSNEIWENCKFWLHFFEASTQIDLRSEEDEEVEEEGEMESIRPEELSFGESESTILESQSLSFNSTSSISPPVLRSKLPHSRLADLSLDSPDIDRVEYEMEGKTPQKVMDGYQDSPIRASTSRYSANKAISGGRKSILNEMVFDRSEFPIEVTKGWNGVADLSNLSLNSFQSPIKPFQSQKLKFRSKYNESSLLLFDSPIVPTTMQYSYDPFPNVPTTSKAVYESTPGRPKAMIGELESNLMEFRDSPLVEPPSVMKNWGQRGYVPEMIAPIPAPVFKDNGKGKGKELNLEEEEEFHFGEGTGTTQRIDSLLNGENELGKIIDDEGLPTQENYEFDDSYIIDSMNQVDEISMTIEEESLVEQEEFNLMNEPEDTLFGMQQRRNKNLIENSFEMEKGFQLMGGNLKLPSEFTMTIGLDSPSFAQAAKQKKG